MSSSSSTLPAWLQYLQALAVLFIAVVGAWIAFRQMEIADARLQLDHYDRRYRVFDAARTLLSEILVHGNSSDEVINAFLLGTGDAPFLFDDSLTEYLREMRKHATSLLGIKMAMEALPAGAEKARASKTAGEHQMWLVQQQDGLADRFRPVLQLNKRQRARWCWFF